LTERVCVITEDYYAKGFLLRLLARKGIHLPGRNILSGRGKSRLLRELTNYVRTSIDIRGVEKVVVLIDGDGRPDETLRKCEEKVPKGYEDRVEFIVFERELEEWVLKGLGISPGKGKPSEVLSDYLRKEKGAKHGYDKGRLPGLADLVDLKALEKDGNFRRLVRVLRDP